MNIATKLSVPFRGIITPMITPLLNDETIDIENLGRLINHLVEGGVHGIFILGTTGEGASLSYKLKHELARLTCKYVNGRVPVFVGITDSSLQESISLAKTAESAGASAVVAALPYYFSLGQQEIKTYFTNLADRVALPLFIYNIPSQTKMMIEAETVKSLASHPQIFGIKDSSGSAPYFNTLLYLMKDDKSFSILVGPDEMMASTVLMGGDGGVNSGSNLFPKLFVDLYNAAASGDLSQVLNLQEKVMAMSAKIYQIEKSGASFLKGLKIALYLSGLCSYTMASPLARYEDKEIAVIKENLLYLNKIICS